MRLRTPLPVLSLALAAALAIAAATAAAGEDEAAQYVTYMREGLSLLRTGENADITRAIPKFKAALKIRPESAEAYYWIALAYSDQNNFLRAADNAKDATIYDEHMVAAWLLWGQVLLYQKEWQEALHKLETAAKLAPSDPQVLYNLGRVYYHGFKDPDAALPKFRAVWQNSQTLRRERPELLPLLVRSRLYMGYCEFDRARWDNAVNAFRDVLTEQPSNADAAFRLALAYRRSNRTSECATILQRILTLMPMDEAGNNQLRVEVLLNLADLYIKDPVLKDRNRMLAVELLQEFIKKASDSNHPALEAAREYVARNEFKFVETP